VADECAAGYRTIDLSEETHEWYGLPSIVSARLDEFFEVTRQHFFLDWEVRFESLASEETVKAFAIFDVSFSVKEYPAGFTNNVFRHWHKTRLDKSSRVEDFVCQITVGGKDDESANNSSVCGLASRGGNGVTCGRLIHSLVSHWPTVFCMPRNPDKVLE
jgi:hypothetical protein